MCSFSLVLYLLTLYICVCVRSLCRQLFAEQTLSGEFGASVIADMSTEGWKHPCHFLWSPEWVCVLYVYSCQRDLLARVRVHIVWPSYSLAGENPMTGGASGRSSCDWRRDDALMVQYMCVCVFFPVCPRRAVSSVGQPGLVMRGATILQPTHWSQWKPTHPERLCSGSVRFSVVPVSLLKFSLLLHFWWLHKHFFYYLSSPQYHTHRALLQNDAHHFQSRVTSVFHNLTTCLRIVQ